MTTQFKLLLGTTLTLSILFVLYNSHQKDDRAVNDKIGLANNSPELQSELETQQANINKIKKKSQQQVITEVDEQESRDDLVETFESREISNQDEFVANLVEIFGIGNPIPLDREAQERLLAKIAKTRHTIVDEELKKGEYDPAYDATWQTDLHIKAAAELNEFFPNASIQNYDCLDGRCALKVTLGDGNEKALSYSATSAFLTSLRSSPAILKSGAKRNIALKEIGTDENGQQYIDYVVGNIENREESSISE